jgi:hypothetical protein
MGCSVALYLARLGSRVVLVDAAPGAFHGASRWNEGKIHLGYLYTGDPSLRTARKLLPGGIAFPRLVKDLVGRDIQDFATRDDDIYLIHRKSVVPADEAFRVAERIAELGRRHPEHKSYFVPLGEARPRKLSRAELENNYDGRHIEAGWAVPERSVQTRPVAELFVEAVAAEKHIECHWNRRVQSVQKCDSQRSAWSVEVADTSSGAPETLDSFDAVVNALWEGRAVIDSTLGIAHSATWTHRYRVSVFARSRMPLALRSFVIAVGPFGDLKNYDGRNLYFSWYPAGLLAEGTRLTPPRVPEVGGEKEKDVIEKTFTGLTRMNPQLEGLAAQLEHMTVRGGWVYAAGTGSLADSRSGLHRRNDLGVVCKDGYFSVDTGKYSTAPWLATQIAEAIRSWTN